MSQKMKTPTEKIKTVVIIGLLAAIVVLLAVILLRKPAEKIVYRNAPAAAESRKGNRSDVSPYVKNEVHNTISKKWGEMKRCYDEFLASTPTPKITDGVISIDWQVTASGEVISPEVVTSQINHPGLEKCLVSLIKGWRFPPPPPTGRNAYVLYKFNFKKTQ